jgi:hypothetical protein
LRWWSRESVLKRMSPSIQGGEGAVVTSGAWGDAGGCWGMGICLVYRYLVVYVCIVLEEVSRVKRNWPPSQGGGAVFSFQLVVWLNTEKFGYSAKLVEAKALAPGSAGAEYPGRGANFGGPVGVNQGESGRQQLPVPEGVSD